MNDAAPARRRTRSRLFRACTGLALGGCATLLAAELVLRMLPVNEGLRVQPVNNENPVLHFEPNRTSTYSKGWNFHRTNEVRTNNAGFVHDADYRVDAQDSLLAIIGDSYVEAAMVPFEETLTGRLHAQLAEQRVYSFAASGAGLAQYLAWARHARDTYEPDAFVFSIVGNDFSDSLPDSQTDPSLHVFTRAEDGSAELQRREYTPSLSRRVLRRSSLAMYLVTNLKVPHRVREWRSPTVQAADRFTSNVPTRVSPERLSELRWTVDSFLAEVEASTGVDADRILLIVDGLRPSLYDSAALASAEESTWGSMRRYVLEKAAASGLAVHDLQPDFLERHGQSGTRFEFEDDNHWSAAGHAVAAEAILASDLVQNAR